MTAGRSVSKDDLAELDRLRAQFDPTKSTQQLESFGRWLFGAVAVLGGLGAAFSNAAFETLAGYGKLAFSLAVGSTGVSLAFAVFAMAPMWTEANPHSIPCLRMALFGEMRRRAGLLTWAGRFIALSLVLAGLAPAFSELSSSVSPPEISYHVESTGKLTARLKAFGLTPGSTVELSLGSEPPLEKWMLPVRREIVDDSSAIDIAIELPKLPDEDVTMLITARWSDSNEGTQSQIVRIPIQCCSLPGQC